MNHYNFDILMNLKNALNVYTNPFEYTKRYGIAILPEKHVTFFSSRLKFRKIKSAGFRKNQPSE